MYDIKALYEAASVKDAIALLQADLALVIAQAQLFFVDPPGRLDVSVHHNRLLVQGFSAPRRRRRRRAPRRTRAR